MYKYDLLNIINEWERMGFDKWQKMYIIVVTVAVL